MTSESRGIRVLLLTVTALVAFAANSILCRAALENAAIDAASFTGVRLASGAALLLALAVSRGRRKEVFRLRPVSALYLFLYAVTFSFAYRSLSTGTGALILFGAVQTTMILAALLARERLHPLEWMGLVLALGGLVILVAPGVRAPSPGASVLMAVAGISWGFYTLRGRRSANPLADTAGNFLLTVPLAVVVCLFAGSMRHLSREGVILAVCSGALASGMGYAIWYAALSGLTAVRAAVVQVSVPVITAVGGVVFLAESVTLRLVLAAVLILGGVGLAVRGRVDPAQKPG